MRDGRYMRRVALQSLWDVSRSSPGIAAISLALRRGVLLQSYPNIADYGVMYWLLSIVLWIAAFDFGFYVIHRAMHTQALYKLVHIEHHAPPTMVSAMSLNFEPSDIALLAAAAVWVTTIMPMHWATINALGAAVALHLVLVHNSSINFFAAIPLLIQSRHHSKHHQLKRQNCNYGAITLVWDKLFGTFRDSAAPSFQTVTPAAAAYARTQS